MRASAQSALIVQSELPCYVPTARTQLLLLELFLEVVSPGDQFLVEVNELGALKAALDLDVPELKLNQVARIVKDLHDRLLFVNR